MHPSTATSKIRAFLISPQKLPGAFLIVDELVPPLGSDLPRLIKGGRRVGAIGALVARPWVSRGSAPRKAAARLTHAGSVRSGNDRGSDCRCRTGVGVADVSALSKFTQFPGFVNSNAVWPTNSQSFLRRTPTPCATPQVVFLPRKLAFQSPLLNG
jgi:hypothetical protein